MSRGVAPSATIPPTSRLKVWPAPPQSLGEVDSRLPVSGLTCEPGLLPDETLEPFRLLDEQPRNGTLDATDFAEAADRDENGGRLAETEKDDAGEFVTHVCLLAVPSAVLAKMNPSVPGFSQPDKRILQLSFPTQT